MEQREEGGRNMERDIRAEAAASGAPTLISFVYEDLRRQIITGAFQPGEKLRVEHIRPDYQVAASTVREALGRLAAEGLAIAEGQRGFRVAPMSLGDLRDLTRLRRLLETEAVLDAIAAGSLDWEAGIAAAFHLLDRAEAQVDRADPNSLARWEDANKAFHHALAAAASRRLQDMTMVLYRQHERYRFHAMTRCVGQPDARPGRDVHGEHRAIMAAVLARDPVAVRALVAGHIDRTAQTVERWLEGQAVPPPARPRRAGLR